MRRRAGKSGRQVRPAVGRIDREAVSRWRWWTLGRRISGRTPYPAGVRAAALAEDYPVTSLDSDALEAARLLATHRLPGLVVTDENGRPHSVLGASQVVRFLVPPYVQDDPSLAAVLDEPFADRVADKLAGTPVRKVLPDRPKQLPVVEADDTILEVAAIMARLRSPLVAVMRDGQLLGVITAARLLQQALHH